MLGPMTRAETTAAQLLGAPERPAIRRTSVPQGGVIRSSYTSQPAPDQWIAVATVALPDARGTTSRLRLLVGVGKTERAALQQLEERLAALGDAVVAP